jgi:hypothetical protein
MSLLAGLTCGCGLAPVCKDLCSTIDLGAALLEVYGGVSLEMLGTRFLMSVAATI